MTGQTLGFVGIGLMGEAMTRNLLDRGHTVTVWNLEPERLETVVPYGARPAASPAAVAEASDIVLLCVLHTAAVESCVFGRTASPRRRGPRSSSSICRRPTRRRRATWPRG